MPPVQDAPAEARSDGTSHLALLLLNSLSHLAELLTTDTTSYLGFSSVATCSQVASGLQVQVLQFWGLLQQLLLYHRAARTSLLQPALLQLQLRWPVWSPAACLVSFSLLVLNETDCGPSAQRRLPALDLSALMEGDQKMLTPCQLSVKLGASDGRLQIEERHTPECSAQHM